MGTYPLWVEYVLRGEIYVAPDDDDDDILKGKLRFSKPQKEERELLDFDPRGELIQVYDNGTLIFDVFFPE